MDQRDATTEPAATPAPNLSKRDRRRIAVASFSGTLIEFYDFQIYGTAAALVFPHVLFPALGTAAGTLASIATFGVAFVARPIGSVLFGHFGDRIGRKRTLVSTLLLMGGSTVVVGLVPTAAQVGVAAPILVTLLRVVQGLAAGGEWAGAALFAGESAPKEKRGFWGMFPQLGGNSAILLVNATFLLTAVSMSNATFLSWGWRIPFLASAVLVGVGLWVRMKLEETPVFTKEIEQKGEAKLPFSEVLKQQPRALFLATGASLTIFVYYYLWTVYLAGYAVNTLHLTRIFVLELGLAAGALLVLVTVFSGMLADRVGRRTVVGWANVAGAVFGFVLFPLLELEPKLALTIAFCVMAVIAGVHYAPLGAFIPELFRTRYRYTASGIAYALSSLVGGTLVPLLAPVIIGGLGSFAMGCFVALLCVVATACTFALPETRNTDLDHV
ncbi:MHS family MFS transporter [Amycolatopsis acidicola]|uniref:MHS family MFS transporter n=1 Tax=Amycolatopsis acidicola TaxID=2596893 RepID=A0A5N0VAA6_9PSEU|nr:MFS transporter [Amycolatopsis acidicola]KAA9163319.1 MHS family MFS transporter [Amycolatopsis acidicola]